MKIVNLGIGIVPVPPGDIAASTEEHIFQLTRQLGKLNCDVHVIDIKAGEIQKQKRQQSPAKFHLVWRSPLPSRYKKRFLQRFLGYVLTRSQEFLFALLALFPLNRLISKEKINIVHTHHANITLVTILACKLRRHKPIIVYRPGAAYGLNKFSRRNRIFYFTETLSLKWVDHIIASTPAVKRWLVSEFKLSPDKITHIYAGTDLDSATEFLTRKQKPCHQSKMVLCTGGIIERKNQLTAVKAIARVVKTHPDVKLIFTGPLAQADYVNSIRNFIMENSLSANVDIKGEVSRHELYELYSDAQLLLFPTTAEIDPDSLRDAFTFGLPVITSKIENIADIVNQEKGCAILVAPYDVDGFAEAVTRLLNDTALRQTMSEKAMKLGQFFSYESIAKQTLALYEKLVQNEKQS